MAVFVVSSSADVLVVGEGSEIKERLGVTGFAVDMAKLRAGTILCDQGLSTVLYPTHPPGN